MICLIVAGKLFHICCPESKTAKEISVVLDILALHISLNFESNIYSVEIFICSVQSCLFHSTSSLQ